MIEFGSCGYIKASEQDGISWTTMSDLEGLRGEIALQYSVQTLPVSFLIGKDGIIIEKFTGYSEDSYQDILNAKSK